MSRRFYRPGSRLWLALRFDDFPLDVLNIDTSSVDTSNIDTSSINVSTEKAMIVTEKQRVIYANEYAQKAGVCYGMDVTTAQLLSNCDVYVREPQKESQALKDLSAALYQFTPYIESYECQFIPQAGLLLEISTCLKLFSGVQPLFTKISHFLSSTPYACQYGFAHTAQGAWLLSFNHYDVHGDETKELFCERLNTLPIQLLHDFPNAIDALEKTGFKTLGDISRQIAAQKITGIKKRLGVQFADFICAVFDIEQNFQQSSLFDKPLTSYHPVEFFSEHIQFDYPISLSEQLHHPIEHLLQNLSNYLRKRQLQCQCIEWTLADIYRNKFLLVVNSDTPESHWELLYDLTLIQLDSRELPFEVDSVRLTCHHTIAAQNRSQLLSFEHTRSRGGARSFIITMAKLKARLGDASVSKLSYSDALLPETTNSNIAINEKSNQQLPDLHKKAMRPAWLLPAPVLIEERKQGLYWRGKLTLLAGPERIRATWWERPTARDYFVAQRHDHVRLWVFLDLHKKHWYVHGIFG